MLKGQSGHLSLPEGPNGLGVVNSRQTPDVFVPPAKVGNQVNIVPTGADNINFVPEDGANLEDIFPQSRHEENVYLCSYRGKKWIFV